MHEVPHEKLLPCFSSFLASISTFILEFLSYEEYYPYVYFVSRLWLLFIILKVSEASVSRNRSTIIVPAGSSRDEGWAAFRNVLAEINEASRLFILPNQVSFFWNRHFSSCLATRIVKVVVFFFILFACLHSTIAKFWILRASCWTFGWCWCWLHIWS